jgi:deoxycytidylate deaminase
VARLYRLYRAYAAHLDAPSRHLTFRRSVALALTVRPVAPSRGSTTRASCIRVPRHVTRLVSRLVTRLVVDYFACAARPGASARQADRRRPCVVSPLDFSSVGRNGSRRASGHYVSRRDYSSSELHRIYCAYTVHPDASLAARLLVGRSHLLSPCVRSLCLAVRLLVVRIAPALLRLCRASGRVVSPLDVSSVGRTGSRHASGHCVSQRDYSSSGLHQLYCTYVVHPDVPSRCSTSRQSVALASLDFSSVGHTGSRRVPSHFVVHRDYLSRGRNGCNSPTLRVWDASARHAACCVAHHRLLHYSACPDSSTRRVARRRLL